MDKPAAGRMSDNTRLAAIAQAYHDGVPVETIKKRFHTGSTMIKRAKKQYSLPDRTRGYAAGLPKRKRKALDKRPRCKRCKIVLVESPDWKHPGVPHGDYCNECRQQRPDLPDWEVP